MHDGEWSTTNCESAALRASKAAGGGALAAVTAAAASCTACCACATRTTWPLCIIGMRPTTPTTKLQVKRDAAAIPNRGPRRPAGRGPLRAHQHATCDGDEKLWSMPPGSNLRRIIMMHPDRLEDAAMLHRRIMLIMVAELESHPVIH